MAKFSENKIPSAEEDWGKDPINGLPYSGEAVQVFIKEQLEARPTNETTDKKILDKVFDGGNGNIVTSIEATSEMLRVTTTNSEGETKTTDFDIANPDTNDRIVTVSSQLSNPYINLGGQSTLNYGVNVTDYQGDSVPSADGTASAVLEVARQGSSVPFYSNSLGSVELAALVGVLNQSVDLTSILRKNITDSATVVVTLTVNYTYSYEKDGVIETKTITKYSTTTLTILNLTLTTNVSIDTAHSGQVAIPFTVKGNGNKSVYLYVNGKLADTITGITSSTFSGNFVDNISSRGSNRVNYQIMAKTAAGDTEVSSSSFYFDLFTGTTSPVMCFKVEDETGFIQEAGYNSPVFNASKFSEFKAEYYIYDPAYTMVPMVLITEELDADGRVLSTASQDQTVTRRKQTFSKKIKSSHQLRIVFKTESLTREFTINPMASIVNIELPIDSLVLNLDADGRSNQESNPASWNYGDYWANFLGINWKSTGWKDGALFLQNGAKAIINFPLFSSIGGNPVTRQGCTFELTFKCDNATLEENDIISCFWKNNEGKDVGLKVTTSYVGVNTGHVTQYFGDNDTVTEIEDRVGSQYAQGEFYKYTFVINPNIGKNGLCLGFLNGILSFVSEIPSIFVNADRLPITIDSTYADVYVESIKYYNEPFTFDQCVDSFIVDNKDSASTEAAYNANDVLAEDSLGRPYVSPARLRNAGRGVMIISPSDKQTSKTYLQDLNKSDNKKTYYGPFRIDYFAPANDLDLGYGTPPAKGNEFNFTHLECAIRIQGTTSTKRPRKNYRLHFNKSNRDEKPSSGSFIVGGKADDSFKYAMSPDAQKVPIACLKADFVDSSMVHNTGGAVIFNEITRNVAELRNPALIAEYNGNATDIKTRVAIEGFPIDVFAADEIINGNVTDTLEDSNYRNLVYMGQYNYNNDKSKSGSVFGFDGAYTYDEEGNQGGELQPICIEFLDNQSKLDLFQVQFNENGEIDGAATYSDAAFNKALEVRAPEDVTDIVADEGGIDALKGTEWDYIEKGVKRVFNFIGECAKEVAQKNGINPTKLNTWTVADDGRDYLDTLDWTSEKFTSEAQDFFNMYSICAWYIWTDYLIAVDQRAKNMMLYTMDGKHWMMQYYDGDTALGERNDCFLAYDYLTDRTTYDTSASQYAMQGHDSWLWYLVRANFDSMLKSTCNLMRKSGKFSADYLNQILNGQFVGSWSERQYNYSQDYKYIQPLTETGFPSSIATNYINTAQGSREAHRTYTVNNRFRLLDSKYAVEAYLEDGFSVYGSTDVPSNKITIVSSIPYFFGWNTPNTPLQQHQEANAGNDYTVVLNVTGIGTNNPATILGASRIKELIFDPAAAWTMQNNAPVSLPNLEKLIAKDMGNRAQGTPILSNNPLLKHIDFSGSSFSGEVVGLEDSGKLAYVNVEDTNITGVPVADGCPIEVLKLATPTAIYLSNLQNIKYNNSADDTLTAQDWSRLDTLSVNSCPNVDWMKLVNKLSASTATNKYLRITGINETKALSWLDQFESFRGLSGDGHADLQGTLQLVEYTDDDAVEAARAKYPSLSIKQPEYTLIELDETVTDESGYGNSACCVSNLDNETGLIYGTDYVPSGHISKIFKNTHRYLGKLVTPGKPIVGNPFVKEWEPINMRDNSGVMKFIQLADADSRYYDTDYDSYKREADLSGVKGKGETFSIIGRFWYKGINYNTPLGARPSLISKRYIAFSSAEDQPEIPTEIRVIKVDNLLANPISSPDSEGLVQANSYLVYTNDNGTVDDRLDDNNRYNVVRVNVSGYKKVRYPMIYQDACCLFTDAQGRIIEVNGTVQTKDGVGSGEVFCASNKYGYNGMPLIATIPEGSVYFYITVPKYITSSVTAQPCDIVLHKGTKFANGDAMNEDNAREWIADMEPEWVQSPLLPIAAAECAVDNTTLGIYSPFDGKKTALRGTRHQENSLNSKLDWFQHRFSEAAFNRGLMLIDYEATKIIAILFVAKYGRRNSQNVLGGGSHIVSRMLGATRQYGMTDTMLPEYTTAPDNEGRVPFAYMPTKSSTGSTSYTNVGSNNFLGIENVSGNVAELMDRVFLVNESSENLGKLRIIMPDLTERKVYASTPSGSYPSSIVHGKNCDIVSCSPVAGGTELGYTDYQSFPDGLYGSWEQVRAIRRSHNNAYVGGGVFCVHGDHSVAYSSGSYGSRLMFRGNAIITKDIEEFENTEEWRG